MARSVSAIDMSPPADTVAFPSTLRLRMGWQELKTALAPLATETPRFGDHPPMLLAKVYAPPVISSRSFPPLFATVSGGVSGALIWSRSSPLDPSMTIELTPEKLGELVFLLAITLKPLVLSSTGVAD